MTQTNRPGRRGGAARGARLHLGVQARDEHVGELLARLHLPLPGRRDVHAVRGRRAGRWPADDLVAAHRRRRTVPRGAGLRRGRLAVPGRRWCLSVGSPAVGQTLGLADRLGLHRGAADHDRRGGLRGRPLSGCAARVRAGHHLHDHLRRDHAGHRAGPEHARHQGALDRGRDRFLRRAARRARRRRLAADPRAPQRPRGALRHQGRRGQRAATWRRSSRRRSSASTSTTASRPAATSPRRCPTRPARSPRRCG